MKKLILFLFGCVLFTVGCNHPREQTQRLLIASQKGDCVGVAPQKCLIVKDERADIWSFWYQDIEGFSYEPGYEYLIEVKVDSVQNPPADASSLKYTFVKEISKEKKESEGISGLFK